jgi:hypothetical protein
MPLYNMASTVLLVSDAGQQWHETTIVVIGLIEAVSLFHAEQEPFSPNSLG